MSTTDAVARIAHDLALQDFTPPTAKSFESDPIWAALRGLGSRLWLDTGDLDAASKLWTSDFSNLTTNNTLVNKEVQKGLFDQVIRTAAKAFREADPNISDDALVTEIGFVVNCRTALRLVEAFNATVSVELHPGISGDAELSTEYGRRYYAVCPEKFIVKVPLTPAGFLTARRLANDGIPVNYTLGFSARQNVLAAAVSRPAFVNVFLGRLNSFVKDSGLGDGVNVGERTTAATQKALREGREERGWNTQLIGASLRSGQQVYDLAGLDVFTMPPAAAQEFKEKHAADASGVQLGWDRQFEVETSEPEVLSKLWEVPDDVYVAAQALAGEDTSFWTGAQFEDAVRDYGLRDLFRAWTPEELDEIKAQGKIPSWERWSEDLKSGRAALDDLMTQSALYSFVTDQAALDAHIRGLL